MWDSPQALRWLANALFAVAALAAAYTLGSWALALPVFPLKEVIVSGSGGLQHVTRGEIETMVRREIKGNFFTADLEAARVSFQQLPWVRAASVRRHWPQGLEVVLEEHVPLARWSSLALVNEHGEVFAAAGGERLPLFNGPAESASEMARHYAVFSQLLQPLGQRIVQLDLSPRYAWRLQLDNGTALELGREQAEARLRRYVSVYAGSIGKLDRQLQQVDLRYPNGFAVRMPEAAQPQPPASRRPGSKKTA